MKACLTVYLLVFSCTRVSEPGLKIIRGSLESEAVGDVGEKSRILVLKSRTWTENDVGIKVLSSFQHHLSSKRALN